ncbi:putative PSME3-interacting protein [Helianthus annuus]|nr:putative PSME3-interacting protein [Helianthus annuus]
MVNWICETKQARRRLIVLVILLEGGVMADDGYPPVTRLMNFVSQEQLDEAKKTRGPRVEDGTAQRDRPLFEILKENKDKKDAEFNERFKHRPPKALDEDETEFLDNLELSRREYEQHIADEEAKQLRCFQEQVAAQSAVLHELKESPVAPPKLQEQQPSGEKKTRARPPGVVIKVKPQQKKAKISTPEESKPSVPVTNVVTGGLVSYSDESDDDD